MYCTVHIKLARFDSTRQKHATPIEWTTIFFYYHIWIRQNFMRLERDCSLYQLSTLKRISYLKFRQFLIEFSLNRDKLSLNLLNTLNSASVVIRWSMNESPFKDPVCYRWLGDSVVRCGFATQEVTRLNPFDCLLFCHWFHWIYQNSFRKNSNIPVVLKGNGEPCSGQLKVRMISLEEK